MERRQPMHEDLEKMQREDTLEHASYFFRLLSEPTRLRILTALCDGERAVNAIVSEIDATQANVSRQLNMLYHAKVLTRRKEGTQVLYRISDPETIALCRTICRRKAIAIRNQADGCDYDTCRLPDMRCGIDGARCKWELASAHA